MITDCHTHRRDATDAIISIGISDNTDNQHLYSVAIHPWEAAKATPADMEHVAALAQQSDTVMIGECGIDRLCDADIDTQISIFKQHVEISENIRKPLLLHCIKAYSDIIALKKQLRPLQPWIIHGYRGKPSVTEQLLRHGFYISIGEKFNTDSLLMIPDDRLLIETDESTLAISDIAEKVAAARHVPVKNVIQGSAYNIQHLINSSQQ